MRRFVFLIATFTILASATTTTAVAHNNGNGRDDNGRSKSTLGGIIELLGPGGLGRQTLRTLDRTQARFEDALEELQEEYEEGVNEDSDFFNSDAYAEIVEDTQQLVIRHAFFLASVDRASARLDEMIASAEGDLAYYQELLAEFEARTDLSATQLARVSAILNRQIDKLTDKIADLTDEQQMLASNLETYESFSATLDAFLAEIVAADATPQ